jgi:hypothetical protein
VLTIKSKFVFPDLREILAARDALFAAQDYGPFVIWIPRSGWADYNLDCDYIPVGTDQSKWVSRYTVRRRILDLIERFEYAWNMVDHRMVMVGERESCQIICPVRRTASDPGAA